MQLVWLAASIAPVVVLVYVLLRYEARWWQQRRFRVHLSTVMLSTILAAGILTLNVRPIIDLGYGELNHIRSWNPNYFRGWPFSVVLPAYSGHHSPAGGWFDFLMGMSGNALIGLNIVSLLAIGLEKWIERKKKQSIAPERAPDID